MEFRSMKRLNRILLVIPILLFALILTARSAQAAGVDGAQGDPGVLCLPGVYMHTPGDCTPLGPSTYLTEMAELGITFPPIPIPAEKPDFALTYVNVRYGEVRNRNAPVYASLDEAVKGNKKKAIKRIDVSFGYISYTDEAVVDGKRFYMIAPDAWMTASDIIRVGAVPYFRV